MQEQQEVISFLLPLNQVFCVWWKTVLCSTLRICVDLYQLSKSSHRNNYFCVTHATIQDWQDSRKSIQLQCEAKKQNQRVVESLFWVTDCDVTRDKCQHMEMRHNNNNKRKQTLFFRAKNKGFKKILLHSGQI